MPAGVDPASRRVRFPLAWKLALALLLATAALLAFLMLEVGPAAERGFAARSRLLIDDSAEAMRALARDSASRSSEVLVNVIRHTAEARGRLMEDLPLTLYGGDVERMRGAIVEHETARRERLVANVGVLAGEMERRAERQIGERVAALAEAQATAGARFGAELRRSHLLLAGATLLVAVALLGFGLERLVVRPIRRLRSATRAVAGGELAVVVAPGSADEVGALARDFAAMVEQIRASRAEVQQKNLELQRWNETLEAEVRRKTLALVHAAKMSAIGTLAGGVAHEFNNLIGGIRGCAAEALADESDAGRREPLEVILRAADRAQGITAQLLRFARPVVGHKDDVDLVAMVDEVLRLLDPQAKRLAVAVARELPPTLRVVADASALHQVLLNLATNALQAMPGGGALTVRGRDGGEQVEIEVEDTGVGIAEGELDRVFEPFRTSRDREADPARRGTGLGLSVSYSICEAHGGALTARSRLGEGSVFTVRLPKAPVPPR